MKTEEVPLIIGTIARNIKQRHYGPILFLLLAFLFYFNLPQIKSERIADVDKLKNVKHELSVLSATRDAHLSGIDGLAI